ncbi:hypothetical protein L0Y59_03995, partial [Candidatus Uhrbacteria bacterium]|nr:hypothetical protein [Candidatus Uhrbacteria bacterium]
RAIRMLLIASGDEAARTRLASGDEAERVLAELVGTFPPAELSDMALLFMERRRDAKQGIDPRFSLELAVTAIALGVLPNGPGSDTGKGTVVAASTAPAIVSETIPTVASRVTTRDLPESAQGTEFVTSEGPSLRSGSESSTIPNETNAATDLTSVRRKWSAIVKAVAEKSPSLNFILTMSRPEAVDGRTVVIRFQYAFHREKTVGDAKNKRLIEDVMNDVLGADVCIDGVVGEDDVRAERRSEDMVSNIIRAFGGQMVD